MANNKQQLSASFSKHGMLKAMSTNSKSENIPVHLEFLKYGVRQSKDERSGAYLFLPDGPAVPMHIGSPAVLVVRGQLESSVTVGLPFAIHENILRDGTLEIRNRVDIGNMDNTEIVMRVSTGINSTDDFYTDLNGLQLLKRHRLAKLPIQANYYPVPSQMFVQDEKLRLTLLNGQPLGGSSLTSGQVSIVSDIINKNFNFNSFGFQLEIMQDRRLNQDDNRGLGQGVLDNQPVLNIFKLILENVNQCKVSTGSSGYLTEWSNSQLKALLHPLEKLVWHENEWIGVLSSFGADRISLDADMEIAVLRDLPHIKQGKRKDPVMGVIVHRTNLEKCSSGGSNGIVSRNLLLLS